MQRITWFASLWVFVIIVSTGGCSSGKLEGADAGEDAAGEDGLAPEDGTAQDADAGGDDGGLDAEDDGESDGEDGADGGDEAPLRVYYIDFENGDDSNDGLSTQTAFRHIPGTRTGSIWNSSYVTTDFGQGTFVANQSRIPPGTHLRIKSGSVHDGTSGGSILIGPDFYQSGTVQEPVVIERDATWGSGPVVIDGDSVPLDQYDSMLYVHRLDNVWIRGNGAAGITIRNSPRNGINLRGNSDKDAEGLRIQDILVEGFSGFGAAADYVSGYEIVSVELDGKSIAGNGGFHFGEHPCSHGVFKSCSAHHLGDEPGAQSGGTDVQIGFWLVNSRNVTYRDCTAYSNEGDGYDVGLVDASEQNATDEVKYINCTSYDNADGYGANAGEGLSHDVKIYYINSIARENVVGFHAYGGTATYHYVHSLAHGNKNVNFHIGPDGWNDGTQVNVIIYNSVGYKPDSGDDFHKANLLTTYIRDSSFNLDSDYNFWEYKDITLDSNFCCWDCYAGDDPYVSEYTYENGPGSTTTGWYTTNEDGHLHCDGHSQNAFLGHQAAFRDEANHDYHLTPSSDLRGAGLDLTTRPWFTEEMGYDRDGEPRSSWDIGPYEYNQEETTLSRPYYGCAWNADGLANLEVGRYSGRMIAYRFRAEHGGDCNQARFFFIFRAPGYYAGDGGEVLIELQADDESAQHLPSGYVMASAHITDPMAEAFPLVTFDRTATLEQGRLYHFVFTNPAPDPVNNYVSIDDLYNQTRTPDMQPAVSDTDLAVLFKSSAGGDWEVNYGHTPVLDLYYGDGFVQGQGYMDAWVSSSLPIAGEARIRQTFTVNDLDRIVTHVSARLRRVGAPGALTVRIEHDDGTLVEEATLSGIGDSYAWVTAELQQARLLEQGRSYHAVLSAPPGDHYEAFVLQQGTSYGFQTPTMFLDGHAQYSSGSGWQNVRDRTDSDFQLYFTVQ